MKPRNWVIRPSILVAIFAGFLAYTVIAELLGFELFGPGVPNDSISFVRHRFPECMFLWFVACSAVIAVGAFRKRRPPRTAAVWPLVVVPLALAVAVAAIEAWRPYSEHLERTKRGIPSTSLWMDVGIPLTMAAFPLVAGAFYSFVLIQLARASRQTSTPGVCPVCAYDLTGNVSGRCPECGERVVNDPNIPREFFVQNYRWLPELSRFPDAKARYDAWRQARRDYLRTGWAWITLLVILGLGLIAFYFRQMGRYWYAGLGAVMCLSLADALKMRWLMRRSLRKQLQARGQCPACGGALASGQCTACRPAELPADL